MTEDLILEVIRGIVDWRYVLTSSLLSYLVYYVFVADLPSKRKRWKEQCRRYITFTVCSVLAVVFLLLYQTEWTALIVSYSLSQIANRQIIRLLTKDKNDD